MRGFAAHSYFLVLYVYFFGGKGVTKQNYWRNGMNSQVKTPWAKVTSVISLDDYQLQIVLENNQQMVLDLKDLIASKQNYWRLQNPVSVGKLKLIR